MKCSIVIPARIGSTRFPRKVLADLCGKPVIQRVYENAVRSGVADDVVVLSDSDDVADVVVSFGGQVIMTSQNCTCGADRIASVIDKIGGDIVVNVQGDEPLLSPDVIRNVVELAHRSDADIFTPIYKINDLSELDNPNRVKVAVGFDGTALYFSRSVIPFVRGVARDRWVERTNFWGHIGVYGYKKKVLEDYRKLKDSALEHCESLEQLRFLENGYKIATVVVESPSFGIDLPEDLNCAESILMKTASDC